jgi:translation initiation factor IF-3
LSSKFTYCSIYFSEDTIINKEIEINDRITDAEIRVIDENGVQLGIMSSIEANRIADERNLDLVKINPGGNPPVCKIMDYGKFKFDAAKREKDARKNQKVTELKEIWLSMTIDTHDLETKAKQCLKFLKGGDKVKVSIRMRGRQQAHASLGVEVMNEFYEIVKDACIFDKKPMTEGRNILMILAPKK